MRPLIPADDPSPSVRAEELARHRETYAYTWFRPDGVASAREVPKHDGFTARVGFEFAGVKVALRGHELASRLREAGYELSHAEPGAAPFGWAKGFVRAARHAFNDHEERATPARSLRYFGAQRPPLVSLLADALDAHDLAFAFQRAAGPHPLLLRRVDAVPDDFGVTEADIARATDKTDSLAAAGAEGRLYLADWTALAGITTSSTDDGQKKHVYAPYGLFARSTTKGGALVPLAIQCGPKRSPEHPVYVPGDGARWNMAKLIAQCADLHLQALDVHLARCHFLMEAFTLAAMRSFADAHPVKVLLRPHTRFTLAINHQVRDQLMLPGGDLETLLAASLGSSLDGVQRSLAGFDLAESLPPRDVLRRGLEGLRDCPYRDEGVEVFEAIRTFVSNYLAIYYSDDAKVGADPEVAAFAQDLAARYGGRIPSIEAPKDRAALAELLSFVIFTAGPLHSIANYAQFDFMGYSPNMPTALFSAPPGPDHQDLDALYMPEGLAIAQYGFFYEQTKLLENHLGDYAPSDITDDRVAPLMRDFQAALRTIDAAVDERNRHRLIPFTWLSPRNIPASIHA